MRLRQAIVAGLFLCFVLASFGQVRSAMDTKLGLHDVYSLSRNRMGCQSCHVPHNARQTEYIWEHLLPTAVGATTLPTLDGASFHTNSCMSCHDGVTAKDVLLISGRIPSIDLVASDAMGLANDHPVNLMLTKTSPITPRLQFTRLFTPSNTTLAEGDSNNYFVGKEYGKVECGSCHDPHLGMAYMYLRAPSGTLADYTFSKLELCRDCHTDK